MSQISQLSQLAISVAVCITAGVSPHSRYAWGNLTNRCRDIKYFNLNSATLWSYGKNLHRASVEVVTRISCHPERPIWRYATLCVLSKMYRNLLFNNLCCLEYQNYFHNFLSGESTDAVCKVSWKWVKSPRRKSSNISQICGKSSWRKWACPISRDPAQLSERVDIRFLNMQQSICEF